MKHLRKSIIIIVILPLLFISACGDKTTGVAEETDSKAILGNVSLKLAQRDMEKVSLNVEESAVVESLITRQEWEEEVAECLNDVEFVLNGNRVVYYHTGCGTFNDYDNNRHLTLNVSEREVIYEIISNSIGTSGLDVQ